MPRAPTSASPASCPSGPGDEPYTLTVLIPQRPEVADYKDNDLTRWIESSCNVNLEFEYLPSDDANQKLAIMINSGDKLPDIICTGNISVSDAYNYGQAGALLDVSDYYKNGLAVNADKAGRPASRLEPDHQHHLLRRLHLRRAAHPGVSLQRDQV